MKKLIGLERITCPVDNCKFSTDCSYSFEQGGRIPNVDFSIGSGGLTSGFLYLVCQSYEEKRKPGRPKVIREKKEKWTKILKSVPIE
jgi:hypothetical protein